MTTEERLLRLENAFTTLSELAANAQSGIDRVAGLVAQEQERTDALLQLVRDHDERLVTQTEWINQLGASLERTTQTLERVEARLNMLEGET